jgi:hypothetical protein
VDWRTYRVACTYLSFLLIQIKVTHSVWSSART